MFEAVLHGDRHVDDLAATGDEGSERDAAVVDMGDLCRPHRSGEVENDAGIDLIGLGQTAAGPGEIADLAGIDDGDRNIGGHQRPDGRHLVTAGGFDDDKLCAGYRRRERGPACCIVVEADNGAFAFDSNVEMGLRNIDTDHESFGGMHGVLLLATRAQGPTNRSSEDMATEMLAEARVQNPRMTRIPAAQPHYTATATYKDEALVEAGAAFPTPVICGTSGIRAATLS